MGDSGIIDSEIMIRIKIRDLNIFTERVVIFYAQTTIFIINTLDNKHGSLDMCQILITFWLILRIRMFERLAQANYFLETQFIGDQ